MVQGVAAKRTREIVWCYLCDCPLVIYVYTEPEADRCLGILDWQNIVNFLPQPKNITVNWELEINLSPLTFRESLLTRAHSRSTASSTSSWWPILATPSSSRSWCVIFSSCSPLIFSRSKLPTYCWRLSSKPWGQKKIKMWANRSNGQKGHSPAHCGLTVNYTALL